jgi:hypothetical protein
MKLGRNDLCLCGSKLKYKKCCLGKVKHLEKDDSFVEFISSNNSIELLKIASLIQLLPKNHSKVVRLETIQDSICSKLSNISSNINLEKFKSIIHKDFASDYREDPSECSFTENLTYINGNNIVFPGISAGSTNVNQILLNSIVLSKNELSESTKNKIKDGALILLYIHNQIAEKLNYERLLFDDDYKEKISFPTNEFINSNINLFEFTKENIQYLYSKFNIEDDLIAEFTCTPEEINNHNQEETLLTIKPFVLYNDKYYLALPTAEMYSLNLFIRRVISESNELDILNKIYDKYINHEVLKYLGAYWKSVKTDLFLTDDESIWQFDSNKFAYVCYINGATLNLESRANDVIKCFRNEFKNDDLEFLSLHFFASFEINEIETHMFEDIKEAKYQLALSFFDFERIYTYWDIDKLSLWKYVKAEARLNEKGTMIAPFFSILTYYKWYVSNKESFFHSDDARPDMMSFDFSMQGEVIIDADKKNDKHLILYYDDEQGLGYTPVIKTEKYAPIYTSEEIFNGNLKVVLQKFPFPIWITCKQQKDSLGGKFIESILYWFNELYQPLKPLLIPLGKFPIEFILIFDDMLREFVENGKEMPQKSKINIDFKICPETRKIELIIPIGIFNAVHREDNHGERIIMNAIIKCLNNLLIVNQLKKISDKHIEKVMSEYMPLGKRKILITANSDRNIQAYVKYLPKVRYIYPADTSIVLEENVTWLNYEQSIPKKIINIEDKIKLCDDLINSLTIQLRNRICQYDSKILLSQLMLRHEALLQKNGFKDIGLTARLECFSKYDDIVQEYKDFNSKLIKASHSVRCLIEYIVSEPYSGIKKVNDDDTDFLLALMSELIFYGTVKDSLKFGIDNPDMGILPSGRIGMNHDFYENVILKYSESVTFDEIEKSKESFSNHFKSVNINNNEIKSSNLYYEEIDNAFENDIGIAFSKISVILIFLTNYCFDNKNSIYHCTELEFFQILSDKSNLTEKEIKAFIGFMAIETRGKMEIPKNLNEYPEIYPWRYNREYSYVRRPILKLKTKDNSFLIYWSARHLDVAMENLHAIFKDGILKVNKEYKEITKLILERNNIKGIEFRNKVYSWLTENTSLQVIKHEVKIRKSTFSNADRDYGDIDILAFDLKNLIIYSVECKNTKQVKIMYDFSSDIKNYLTRQLPKHITRGTWLKENLQQVSEKFNLDLSKFEVKSIVISSYQLPIKFIEETPIPIYSLSEIKREMIFNN